MADVGAPSSSRGRKPRSGPAAGRRTQTLFPLTVKLSLAVSILLVFSLGAIIFSVWFLIRSDIRNTAVADTDGINYRVAAAAETALEQVKANTSLLLGNGARENMVNRLPVEFFFARHPEIAAVVALGAEGLEGGYALINRNFTLSRGIDASLINAYLRLRGGRILEEGPAKEFFTHPQKERTRQFLRQFSQDYSFQI